MKEPIAHDPPAEHDRDGSGRLRRLLLEAQNGCRESHEQFLRLIEPDVRRCVQATIGQALRRVLEIDDVTQRVLLDVHRSLPKLDLAADAALSPWIASLVRNELAELAAYHGAARRAPSRTSRLDHVARDPGDGGVAPTALLSPSDVPGEAARRELARLVQETVAGLPPGEVELIRSVDLAGASISTVAQRMGISDRAARRRHRIALARLGLRLGRAWRGSTDPGPAGDR